MSKLLVCIDAGHCLKTPGKRCMKAIDPKETREWVLNSRIAEKVLAGLAEYEVDTMRADDPTGKTNVSLSKRARKANEARADVYVSIHHNAGVNGGTGGGIAVYVQPGCMEQSRVVQKAIYEATVKATGLRGNRANPTPEKNLKVLRETDMPAVLGEFGFMDSAKDTPIILTEEYAEGVAKGIVEALATVYELKEVKDEVTQEQFDKMMDNWLARRAKEPADDWAKPHIQRAIDAGAMTDVGGSIERPRAFVTRQELAVVAANLAEKE